MVVLYAQSCLPLRNSNARAGVVMASTSSGLPMPASMMRMFTLGFSARRPATAQPEVPPEYLSVSTSLREAEWELSGTSNYDEVELLRGLSDGRHLCVAVVPKRSGQGECGSCRWTPLL